MSFRLARLRIVGAIVGKDLREYARDRLWLVLAPMTMILAVGLVWLLPDRVEETILVGVAPAHVAVVLEAMGDSDWKEEGLRFRPFSREEDLIAAMEDPPEGGSEIALGLLFPADYPAGDQGDPVPTVQVIASPSVPIEIRRTVAGIVRELAHAIRADSRGEDPEAALPVRFPPEDELVVGPDRAGEQVPLREKMRPMLAALILVMEALALAGLMAVEIEEQTVRALLVTPVRTGDLLLAKVVTGTLLGLGQILVFLLATRSFGEHPLSVLLMSVLGAILMAAVGMIVGSSGRDFMGTLFYGVAFLIPLMIPSIAVLLPGSSSLWIRALPTWGIMEGMVRCVGYGQGWSELGPHFLATVLWTLALLGVAGWLLRRRVAAL